MADDWFRSPAWDADAREEFEKRLRRAASSNRQQYLRIKALALEVAGLDDDAVEMLTRSIDDGTYFFQVVSAWESLGDIAARRGNTQEAIGYYRKILTQQPSGSGTSGSVEISLAELLLSSGRTTNIEEAISLLDAWIGIDGLKFNSDLFRWHLARIQAAQLTSDPTAARESASVALQLAGSGPQLPRHKTVGLVHVDELTLKLLRDLSA